MSWDLRLITDSEGNRLSGTTYGSKQIVAFGKELYSQSTSIAWLSGKHRIITVTYSQLYIFCRWYLKLLCCWVTKWCLTLLQPHGLWSTRLLCTVIPSLCMGFSRQEYWNELPLPSPGDLPQPGTEPPTSVLASRFLWLSPSETSRKPNNLQLWRRRKESLLGERINNLDFYIYIFCILTFSYEVVWFFIPCIFFLPFPIHVPCFFFFVVQLNIRHAEIITE